ncbi:MAG: choice-of-anchor B family protein [Saprospiraceae bacterium]
MRLLILAFCCLFAAALFGQNQNVTFQSKTTYTGQTLSNIWGYADGATEYALIGAKNGLIVTDVTAPAAPVQIVQIAGPVSQWREIKTYQHYAYVATEGGGGLQIVDLSPLPSPNLPVVNYTGGGTTPGTLSTIHALQVDEAKGFLYLYGTNLVGGRACVFDLNQDPAAPVYKGYYNPIGYAHDGYVNNDTMYAAHINAGKVSIVDMTIKTDPNDQIGVDLALPITTPFVFSHNTWRYGNTLFTTDEKANAPLAAYDISDFNDIVLLDQIENPNSSSIVHNTYIKDGYAITSWYIDGFTIVDVNRPANLVQVGNYDTYTNTGTGFNGAWGVYPFLPSGNILVSNINGTSNTAGEMWVLTPTYQRGCYIEGQITDDVTGNPVTGALVELLTTSTKDNSNTSGNYKMGQLQSGNYTFKVTKTGYDPYTQNISISNGTLTTVNAALTPSAGCTYVTHNSQNFDASWGIWTDGGTDCARINNAAFAKSGTYSIQLRDNTSTSVMTTTSQNCTGYSEMKVSFSYITTSFEANEDFWLQISTNGGSSYTTVGDYNAGVEFSNGVRKDVEVTIPGPFTTNTRFRFRADASADDDQVYIDDVVISGCQPPQFGSGGVNENMAANVVQDLLTPNADVFDVKTGPNPASDFYKVTFMAKSEIPMDYVILDMTGQVVLQEHHTCQKGANQLDINVQDLAKGAYIISLRTANTRFTQKLILARSN